MHCSFSGIAKVLEQAYNCCLKLSLILPCSSLFLQTLSLILAPSDTRIGTRKHRHSNSGTSGNGDGSEARVLSRWGRSGERHDSSLLHRHSLATKVSANESRGGCRVDCGSQRFPALAEQRCSVSSWRLAKADANRA